MDLLNSTISSLHDDTKSVIFSQMVESLRGRKGGWPLVDTHKNNNNHNTTNKHNNTVTQTYLHTHTQPHILTLTHNLTHTP